MTFSIDPDFWLFQPGPPQDAMPGTASSAGRGRDFAASLLIAPVAAQSADESASLFAAVVPHPPASFSFSADLFATPVAKDTPPPLDAEGAALPGGDIPAENIDASGRPALLAPLPAALPEPALTAADASLEAYPRIDSLPSAPSAPTEENRSAWPEASPLPQAPEDGLETDNTALLPASISAGTEAKQDSDSTSTPAARHDAAAITGDPAATALPEANPVTQGLAVASAAIPPRPVGASQMHESATPQPASVEPVSGKPLPETTPSQTVRAETIEPSLDTATPVAALSGTERQSTGGEPQQAPLLATAAQVPAGPGPTSAPVTGLTQLAPAQAILVASTAEIPAIVARASSDAQNDRITVQLDPPELGRVSIDFKFDAQGLQLVTVTAETPEAMRQLRAMHFELVQALERQGFSGHDMTFQQQTSQQKNEQALPGRPYAAPYDADGSSGGGLPPETTGAARQLAAAGGRLDLRL